MACHSLPLATSIFLMSSSSALVGLWGRVVAQAGTWAICSATVLFTVSWGMAVYTITLRTSGIDPCTLRLLLKRLLRFYGLRCVSVEEADDRSR